MKRTKIEDYCQTRKYYALLLGCGSNGIIAREERLPINRSCGVDQPKLNVKLKIEQQ